MTITQPAEPASVTKATLSRRLAGIFGLERDGGWERHANPASVWARFAALPLIVLGIWSRDWIGAWAVIPTALAIGLVPLVYGLVQLDVTTTVLGLLIVQGAKFWYLDRMVLLFDDVKHRPEYAAWDYEPAT